MTGTDSLAETLEHSRRVGSYMGQIITELVERSYAHDLSKTRPPEKDAFDVATGNLRGLTYGSPEYRQALADLGPALEHHYRHNRHHPEHHDRGVDGMTLMDLVEMLADWLAATQRHADGDLTRSMTISAERFGISDQLAGILTNTAAHLGWVKEDGAADADRDRR
jgi:hypothetical protein